MGIATPLVSVLKGERNGDLAPLVFRVGNLGHVFFHPMALDCAEVMSDVKFWMWLWVGETSAFSPDPNPALARKRLGYSYPENPIIAASPKPMPCSFVSCRRFLSKIS